MKLGLEKYNKRGDNVKHEVKTKLNNQTRNIGALENFNDLLQEYICLENWDVFERIFTGLAQDHNIFPGCSKLSPLEAEKTYRREGQSLQIIYAEDLRDEYGPKTFFIFQIRVFPYTEIIKDSGILKTFSGIRIKREGIHEYLIPTGESVVVKIFSSEPKLYINSFFEEILEIYAIKFHLTKKQRALLVGNKTGDDKNHHPEFYKYEETRNPFEGPTKANLGFNIKNPDDESEMYMPFGLIALVDVN